MFVARAMAVSAILLSTLTIAGASPVFRGEVAYKGATFPIYEDRLTRAKSVRIQGNMHIPCAPGKAVTCQEALSGYFDGRRAPAGLGTPLYDPDGERETARHIEDF